MRLFLSGDVMTGRGIDQIGPHPVDPVLFEPFVLSALDYVALAEEVSGPIPRQVESAYIWGDALAAIDQRAPDYRLVNLETAITARGEAEPKGINYRMHPDNAGCLQALKIDCCALANNHVLDWGGTGLTDTLDTLARLGIAAAGAGETAAAAAAPAISAKPQTGRLLVFAYGLPTSGVPAHWRATPERSGVNYLADLGERALARVTGDIAAHADADDLVVVSIHWGGNWGYDIAAEQRRFAHALIETAGVHAVHGHSSHHPMAIERHRDAPILYGCGDFLNDYEGISGHEDYRPNLTLGYVLDFDDADHRLTRFEMLPFRLHKFQLVRANEEEARWLATRLGGQCRPFGADITLTDEATLLLQPL